MPFTIIVHLRVWRSAFADGDGAGRPAFTDTAAGWISDNRNQAGADGEGVRSACQHIGDFSPQMLFRHRIEVGRKHACIHGFFQMNDPGVMEIVKSSGLGKEASLEAMLEHFMHKKTIMVNFS